MLLVVSCAKCSAMVKTYKRMIGDFPIDALLNAIQPAPFVTAPKRRRGLRGTLRDNQKSMKEVKSPLIARARLNSYCTLLSFLPLFASSIGIHPITVPANAIKNQIMLSETSRPRIGR